MEMLDRISTESRYAQCVSVIVPAFNSEQFIERAILSALKQGSIIREILVFDDCSTDNTFELISAIARGNSVVKCYRGSENLGAGFARRYLMRKATGEYFAFLDADDYWFDLKIEKQIQVMAENHAQICTTDIVINNNESNSMKTLSPAVVRTMRDLVMQNPIPMSSAVVHTSLEGARDMPILRARQDYAYWLMLFKTNKDIRHINLAEKLVIYRRSVTGLSGGKIKNIRNNFLMYYQGLKFGIFLSCVRTFLNIIGKLMKIKSENKYD
ncbi:glycosyltransferase [Octadecabacter sp.]|jgi:teichuronic acid biosynthesis glycosyltransferase TuaG|nr:glycosyltransferase [Octadecabacter sp.]